MRNLIKNFSKSSQLKGTLSVNLSWLQQIYNAKNIKRLPKAWSSTNTSFTTRQVNKWSKTGNTQSFGRNSSKKNQRLRENMARISHNFNTAMRTAILRS